MDEILSLGTAPLYDRRPRHHPLRPAQPYVLPSRNTFCGANKHYLPDKQIGKPASQTHAAHQTQPASQTQSASQTQPVSQTRTASRARTAHDSFLDDTADLIVLTTEHGADEALEAAETNEQTQAVRAEYKAKRDQLIEESGGALRQQIEAYYQSCKNNVDAYLDWLCGVQGGFARFLPVVGKGMAIERFSALVINPVDRSSLEQGAQPFFRHALGGIPVSRSNASVKLPGLR